jgi:DNA-binding LacI/PurR family transcriptional regulator
VGFDDIPEAAFYCPPLSTVRQDFQEVGARALELLLMQIESGKRSDINVTIGCDLIVRESSLPQPYDFEDRTDRL